MECGVNRFLVTLPCLLEAAGLYQLLGLFDALDLEYFENQFLFQFGKFRPYKHLAAAYSF